MNDYIRRKDALDAICDNCEVDGEAESCQHKFTGCAYGRVFGVPTADVVELIRCRDCKYRLEDNFCTGRGWPKQMVADDGFCEKGKRKDGDGE